MLNDLHRRLAAGEFQDGFPGELDIKEQYGVSRYTVREALRRLREQGVVTASRGRRSRALPPTEIEQPIGALYSLFASVRAAGMEQHSIVEALELRTDAVAASRLGSDPREPMLYLERLRLAGAEPLAIDKVWLPAKVAKPLLDVDFQNTALYEELAKRCSIRLTAGREVMCAVLPTASERRMLGIGRSIAALAIERIGFVQKRPFEWRQTLVRGDRFSVCAQFAGHDGYRLVALEVPPMSGLSQSAG